MSDQPHRFHITRTFRRGLMVPEDEPEDHQPKHRWLLKDEDRIVGPWAPWDLHRAWRHGEIHANAEVRREDLDAFIPLRDAWDLVDIVDLQRIQDEEAAENAQLGSGQHQLPNND